jgi:hypothetical protein
MLQGGLGRYHSTSVSKCTLCGMCDIWKHIPICPCTNLPLFSSTLRSISPMVLVSTQQARSEFLGSTLTHVAHLRMPQYMLWPVLASYEFITLEAQNGQSESLKVLEACGLVVGVEYEFLLTTPSGMFFPMSICTN